MSDARPLARDDLDTAPRVIDDETVYFIGDPIKNEYKQLDELQFEIFSRLDGRRTIADLARELYEEFEVEVEVDDLVEFISGLGEMNLLDPSSDLARPAPADADVGEQILARLERDGVVFGRRGGDNIHLPPKGERRRRHDEAALIDAALGQLRRGDLKECARYLRSVLEINPRNFRARHLLHAVVKSHVGKKIDFESIFFFRVPILDPDGFLARLDGMIGRVVYSRLFLLFWALAVGLALVTVVFHIDRLIEDFLYVMTFRWVVLLPAVIPIAWVINVVSGTVLHEVAHGLTCKHFGGRVREMGLLFAYLSQAAYCDVSSTYLISSRAARVLVALSGVMWNLLSWSLMVAIWVTVRTDTTLGLVAAIMVMNVPVYLAQWDPMLRSDGYLALTDLLNYPNLRDDAFTWLKLRLEQLIYGSTVEVPPELNARRRLYLSYAVPGIISTTVFVCLGYYVIAWALIQQLHTVGFLVAAVLFYASIGQVMWTGGKAIWGSRKRLWAARRFRRVFAVGCLLVVGGLLLPWPLRVQAPCETRPTIESVRSPQRGRVAGYLVEHGARVEEGQPLVRLSASALEVALARSRAELKGAELDLEKLQKRARDEELGLARTRLAGERAVLGSNERRLARLRRMARDGLVSYDALSEVLAAQAQARTRAATAAQDMQALSREALDAELRAAEALVSMLRAQVRDDERRLDEATLKSPAKGIVLLPGGRSASELEGISVAAGDELVRVRRVGGEQLELHVPLTAPISELYVGAAVEARLFGIAHEKIEGKLVKLGATFQRQERAGTLTRSVIRAEVSIDDETLALGLPAGLSGEAYVTAGSYPLAWHVYLRFIRLLKVDIDRLLAGTG